MVFFIPPLSLSSNKYVQYIMPNYPLLSCCRKIIKYSLSYIIPEYEDYASAVQAAKRAEITSNVDSDDEAGRPKKIPERYEDYNNEGDVSEGKQTLN